MRSRLVRERNERQVDVKVFKTFEAALEALRCDRDLAATDFYLW